MLTMTSLKSMDLHLDFPREAATRAVSRDYQQFLPIQTSQKISSRRPSARSNISLSPRTDREDSSALNWPSAPNLFENEAEQDIFVSNADVDDLLQLELTQKTIEMLALIRGVAMEEAVQVNDQMEAVTRSRAVSKVSQISNITSITMDSRQTGFTSHVSTNALDSGDVSREVEDMNESFDVYEDDEQGAGDGDDYLIGDDYLDLDSPQSGTSDEKSLQYYQDLSPKDKHHGEQEEDDEEEDIFGIEL